MTKLLILTLTVPRGFACSKILSNLEQCSPFKPLHFFNSMFYAEILYTKVVENLLPFQMIPNIHTLFNFVHENYCETELSFPFDLFVFFSHSFAIVLC